CCRVILFLGDIKGTDGLAWEVDRVFSLSDPEKIILVVPPLPEEAVRARWGKYRAQSRGRLPEYTGREALVTFSPQWEPVVRRLKSRWAREGRDYQAYQELLHSLISSQGLLDRDPFGRPGTHALDAWSVGVFALSVLLGTAAGMSPGSAWLFGGS